MENTFAHIDNSLLNTLKETLPNSKVCNKLALFYSMFSDTTRLKIIITLLINEMCVNDLSQVLGINQTTISHQLKILKSNGAVISTRKNKYIFYRVSDSLINDVMINGVDYILNNA